MMPILLILVGLVGSGKSTLAQSLSTQLDWTRVCQDDLGDRRSCEGRVERALREGKDVVVDRVNFDATQRQHFLRLAGDGVETWCIVFDIPHPILMSRLTSRTSHPTLHTPQQALQALQRMTRVYQPPSISAAGDREGFERVYNLEVREQPQEWDKASLEALLERVKQGKKYPRLQAATAGGGGRGGSSAGSTRWQAASPSWATLRFGGGHNPYQSHAGSRQTAWEMGSGDAGRGWDRGRGRGQGRGRGRGGGSASAGAGGWEHGGGGGGRGWYTGGGGNGSGGDMRQGGWMGADHGAIGGVGGGNLGNSSASAASGTSAEAMSGDWRQR